MSKIQNFMQVYMYELEKFLNTKKEELKAVSFQSDEANTDRPLKEFLKNLIEREFVEIPKDTIITDIEYYGEVGIDLSELKKSEFLECCCQKI